MPGTNAAWAQGDLSSETVDLLIRAAAGKRADLYREEEADLLARIDGKLHCDVVKEIRYWCDHADARVNPDGTPPGRERHLHASPTFGGVVAIDGVLDPVGGAIVMSALRTIDNELRLADKQAAEADSSFQPRTSSERLADALVELANRAMQAPEDGKRPKIALHVAVGNDKLAHLCETFAGVIVKPCDLLDYLADTTVQFIKFDAFGQPEAATRSTSFRRFFTGAMRVALQVRDRRCQHPSGCDEPVEGCDIDHLHPFGKHGLTIICNGRLLCVAHNRLSKLRHPQCRYPMRT